MSHGFNNIGHELKGCYDSHMQHGIDFAFKDGDSHAILVIKFRSGEKETCKIPVWENHSCYNVNVVGVLLDGSAFKHTVKDITIFSPEIVRTAFRYIDRVFPSWDCLPPDLQEKVDECEWGAPEIYDDESDELGSMLSSWGHLLRKRLLRKTKDNL